MLPDVTGALAVAASRDDAQLMLIGVDSTPVSTESGGDTTYWRGLLGGLAAVDQENQYCLFDTRSHPFYAALPERFDLRLLPRPHSLLRLLTSEPLTIRRAGAALIHVQYLLPPWLATPAVVTIHDLHFEHYPEHYPGFDRWLLRWWVPWSARRAERIITVSEFSRQDIHARYGVPLDKITVVANGVSAYFRPERDERRLRSVREKYGIASQFLLFAGRLSDRRKNLLALIDTFLGLDPAVAPGCLLVIAGQKEGQAFKDAAALAEARGPGRVIFVGFVANADLPDLMSAATALVLPSVFEGFGLPILEAMACGTPVVTSNATSLPEVAGDAALYFDPQDKSSLAQALNQILSDAALRDRLRALGLQRAASFSWETCARQTLAVYGAAQARRPWAG